MSNQSKAKARRKRIDKARNMRKNNGIGRTAANQAYHDAKDADKISIGSKLASGFKKLIGR